MQVKIVTVDLRLSQHTQRAIGWALLPLAVLLGSMAVARAYDTTWIASGQTISATKLKGDFDEAQSRLAVLESTMPRITEWTSYAPLIKAGSADTMSASTDLTSSFSTSAFWRRVGDSVEVVIMSVVNICPVGTPTRSGGAELFWSLPQDLASDPAKFPGNSANPAMGGGEAYGPVTGNVVVPTILNAQYAPWASFVAGDVAGSAGGGVTCATVGVGGSFRWQFRIPVVGWTASMP